jgi:predicted AlkP superfamily pyrophosphatase or phosphodiesterase
MYPADGRKIPDIWTQPLDIRLPIQAGLGQFPLFHFWGPKTSIQSTQWIAASAKWIEKRYDPTLTLIYLPHLDYCLQRVGSDSVAIQSDLHEIDRVCGDLIDYYESRNAQVILLSEYGITSVSQPIHLNRILREHGLLRVRTELGREILDAGASSVFAVADHQIAHIYVKEPTDIVKVRSLLESVEGIAQVVNPAEKQFKYLNHQRSGELIAISQPHAWFTYYYWLDDRSAPDFARTVDIHRKPGYDPVELFINPDLQWPQIKVGLTLLKKQLGFRDLLDVISLDASLVKGSHGCLPTTQTDSPLLITRDQTFASKTLAATDVCKLILEHLLA